jgi:hypothetical protein
MRDPGVKMLLGKLVVALACLVAVVSCAAESTPTVAGTTTPVEEDFDVADMVLLQSTWWTWATSAPEGSNPVSDTTGEHCTHDQPADVWLVAGSFGETLTRRCTMPAGVPVAGPAVNLVSDSEADCAAFMPDATGEVRLDGAQLPLRESDAVAITFSAVAGNPVTSEGGEFDGYACGLWFATSGLTPGEHVLEIRGSSSDFAVSVTYELTVTGT